MNLAVHIIIINAFILQPIIGDDACIICSCSGDHTTVHCDAKGMTNLSNIEFPPKVNLLTLIGNKLTFNTIDDRSKIENLTNLNNLNLNQNLLETIPAFNDSNIHSLFLEDNSISSAAFPLSFYGNGFLQKISLSNNKIRTIKATDFIVLKNSNLKTLEIDSASLSLIEQNAFNPLFKLQSLSLKNNQLKTCEFLSSLRLLSSIKLDGNQFTVLPQELSTVNDIKTYFFTNNFISIIDETSPLYIWSKKNYTNIQIYLANNSFDCCQSLWFIRFLKTSSHFVADARLLKCSKPSIYAGQQLVTLNPDKMDCGGIPPSDSWWTVGRIVGVTVGGLSTVLVLTVVIVIFTRRAKIRSGYTEIDGIDDPLPTAPIATSYDPIPTAPISPSNDLLFPPYGQDDDTMSSYSTAVTRHTTGSQAPTHNDSEI